MIVATYGGLANRLRVIFSYAAVGVRDFVWEPDGEICGARFSDVFEPIDGITIRDSGPHDLRTLDVAPRIHPDWVNRYRELRLLPPHASRWAAFGLPALYSAMHVRRTDHVHNARLYNNFTTDEQFDAWLTTAKPDVYLATDNGTTQLYWMRAIRERGRRCHVLDGIRVHERENESGQRNTSLADAAIDLFALAGSPHFMGSGESSFSNLVGTLRLIGGWWS